MQLITKFSQAHIDALQAHLNEVTSCAPLSQAERECVGSSLIKIEGSKTWTTDAGLMVLEAVAAVERGEIKSPESE